MRPCLLQPRIAPPRSRSCSSREPHRADPPLLLLHPVVAHVLCPTSPGSSPPPHRCISEHEVSTETPTMLRTRPSSRGWTEPCELAVCLLPTACSRRRTDLPSPESRPWCRAGRFAGAAAVSVRAPPLGRPFNLLSVRAARVD
jgi:hypothetical protein